MVHAGKKGFVAFAVASVLALTLTGCDEVISTAQSFNIPFLGTSTTAKEALHKYSTQKKSTLSGQALVKEGTLTVGLQVNTSGGYAQPPYVMEGSGDVVEGINIDYACAVADQLGLGIQFVPINDPSSDLGTTCDVIFGIEATSTSANVRVVGAYTQTATAFFVKGDQQVVDASAINGKNVGLIVGTGTNQTVSQRALAQSGLTVNMVTDWPSGQSGQADLNDVFDALSNGKIDYAVCDAYTGAYLAAHYDGISFAGTLDVPSQLGIGVAASNTGLQEKVKEALDTVQNNGVSDLIRKRWVGDFPVLTKESQVTNLPAPAPAS